MKVAHECLSNWSGWVWFTSVARESAAPEVRWLLECLGGVSDVFETAPEDARRIIDALAAFEQTLRVELSLLVDAAGTEVYEQIRVYAYQLARSARESIELSDEGLTVRRGEKVCFLSTHFAVRRGFRERATLVDVKSGASCRVAAFPTFGVGRVKKQELRLVNRPAAATDFAYLTAPLRRVCEASIATGNPICWCH